MHPGSCSRWLGGGVLGVGSTFAVWLLAAAAVAKPLPAAEYDVPGACPPRDAWLARLRDRLPGPLRAHPSLEQVSVHIEGRLGPSSAFAPFTGTMALHAETETSTSREVSGDSCAEVVDALALLAAVRLEQSFAGEGSASEAVELSAADREHLHATELGVGAAPIGDPDVAGRVRVGAVGLLLMQSAIAPGWSFDSGFGLSIAWPMIGFQPWFLLGVYFGTGKEVLLADRSGTARFDHWAVYALGCPWRFAGPGSLAIRPCLDFDVGRSTGTGLGVDGEVKSASPWLSVGAQLRAELELWERLQIGVSAGGFVPLLHSNFSFSPEDTTFEVPPLGFRAGGFASVLF